MTWDVANIPRVHLSEVYPLILFCLKNPRPETRRLYYHRIYYWMVLPTECKSDMGDARNEDEMSRNERSHFFWIAFTSL
jgi:hypothetical protein